MRNSFALAVVLNLVTLVGLSLPDLALGGGCGFWGHGCHHHRYAGCGYGYAGCGAVGYGYGGYDCGGCGYGGYEYGGYYGGGYAGWNSGYLYGGRCAASVSHYGFGYGGYGHADWRFGFNGLGGSPYGGFGYTPSYGGSGGCANCFSVVPGSASATVASRTVAPAPIAAPAAADFESRMVAAAQRVLRPSLSGPAATFVARTDAAPLSRSAARNIDLAEALSGEARQMYWERRYSEAVKVLEQAVQADEQAASAWYFLGLSHNALGNVKAAESSFAKAIAFYPTDSAGERRMAQILERVQGTLRVQLENARLKLQREGVAGPVAITASR